ncbi:MAG: aminotransferase class I/II-fold pyridoxal phosphate-dependent enzyme [Proteobacteria bacterium]|jgi:DNA-binding transcriptional MocR family regulator|uniref:Aminotransferase class I/II-fold pyridoxal phosphate-dependent enzyme n=1 Tax=SAR86 cluster bacterium TaxID=2030880 RepID=A0A937I938_9GAMM|nr:aminotransferase class I/II-fold pyridoxal phosphate-dependent enzyme [SAR86 cluster bacterium]MDA0775215.1 aminotransferase class I/II-fold pyridoxal phosphate-dependent enzyme [Pseudomonadota bacterium]MDA0976295.1 aminotransferase class I/II-fold pyridoxal phosphate-dependent enzyme [Pseudomonadota bacterium]MDA1037055.1 aminotransferase class I/II-fold pyridoxal phosphate-dependent enzyme [Pseudomonadota bacterium]
MSDNILTYFEQIKARGLSIDITRGKPDASQLDLANDLLSMSVEPFDGNVDLRNYGEPHGIKDARILGSEVLSAPFENVITGEQSSLMLTYQMILSKYLFAKPLPWRDIENPKFICPVPGFDRHFRMLEDFGIEMIAVPLEEDGIDTEMLSEVLQNNSNVLGIICVPRHSNPSGEVYSDENINQLFKVGKKYSEDFLFLFDHAYLVHDFLPTKNQTPVWKLAEQNSTTNQTVVVTSFSKVTFGGGGLSFMAAASENLDLIKRIRGSMVICPDKVNQKRHTQFFKDLNAIKEHMKKHADLVKPKFEIAYKALETLDNEIGEYSQPTGGYFITFTSKKGIASRIVDLCKEAGVLLTPAGATHPYGKDPKNNTLRIAPTFINESDLKVAMEVFVAAAQIAHAEN